MNRTGRIFIVFILVFLLILVRISAPQLFYDPFIEFFGNEYLKATFPEISSTRLFLNLFFRYTLNTIISLVIIYIVFQKKQLIFFAIKFYVIAFLVLSIIYWFQLNGEFSNGYLLAFYVRRMLIHPIFLLLLLPAFYYRNHLDANHPFHNFQL